eukprot:1112995_1
MLERKMFVSMCYRCITFFILFCLCVGGIPSICTSFTCTPSASKLFDGSSKSITNGAFSLPSFNPWFCLLFMFICTGNLFFSLCRDANCSRFACSSLIISLLLVEVVGIRWARFILYLNSTFRSHSK